MKYLPREILRLVQILVKGNFAGTKYYTTRKNHKITCIPDDFFSRTVQNFILGYSSIQHNTHFTQGLLPSQQSNFSTSRFHEAFTLVIRCAHGCQVQFMDDMLYAWMES